MCCFQEIPITTPSATYLDVIRDEDKVQALWWKQSQVKQQGILISLEYLDDQVKPGQVFSVHTK